VRIAIDARKLHDGGIGTYIRGLLDAFSRDPRGDEFVAILDPVHVGQKRWPGPVVERSARAAKYGLDEHWVVPAAARETGAEVLHAPHYTLPLGWRGPSVVTIHDLIHLRFPQFHRPGASIYARLVAGSAVSRADVVLVDSESTADDVEERLKPRAGKVRVVPLAVPEGFAAPPAGTLAAFRAAHRLPAGYVLYVGARKKHKNLDLLLRAWSAMNDPERPPLVLSGAPWPAGDPHAKLVAELGLAKWIHFAGHLEDDAALAALYAGAALYAHPALWEGFGLPPLEAMACGTPVISSDAGSLREVLGEAARLLPPTDPEAWAAEILGLLGNTAGLSHLRTLGHAQVARYSWSRTAELTREAYREAMSG
jgi:glycosyltransferase involved in cell wall biosynthesis